MIWLALYGFEAAAISSVLRRFGHDTNAAAGERAIAPSRNPLVWGAPHPATRHCAEAPLQCAQAPTRRLAPHPTTTPPPFPLPLTNHPNPLATAATVRSMPTLPKRIFPSSLNALKATVYRAARRVIPAASAALLPAPSPATTAATTAFPPLSTLDEDAAAAAAFAAATVVAERPAAAPAGERHGGVAGGGDGGDGDDEEGEGVTVRAPKLGRSLQKALEEIARMPQAPEVGATGVELCGYVDWLVACQPCLLSCLAVHSGAPGIRIRAPAPAHSAATHASPACACQSAESPPPAPASLHTCHPQEETLPRDERERRPGGDEGEGEQGLSRRDKEILERKSYLKNFWYAAGENFTPLELCTPSLMLMWRYATAPGSDKEEHNH